MTETNHPIAEQDSLEAIARTICEVKGYDPDSPTGEHTVQWQSFTELAKSTYALWNTRPEADTLCQMRDENEALKAADHRSVMANVEIGKWLSAALDDPSVCEAMKSDIREWFSAGHPPHALTTTKIEKE